MPLIQNFSVPAGDNRVIVLNVSPDDGDALLNAVEIVWQAFVQHYSVPDPTLPAVITKTLEHSLEVDDPTALIINATFDGPETVGLLRNYYHETTLVDPAGNTTTVNQGIMTVTETENRL